MTAQISDTVTYRHDEYLLAGVSGAGLFEAAQHGLEARSTSTANRRGFYCAYAVDDAQLVIKTVHIGLEAPAPLYGTKPTWDKSAHCWMFDDLDEPIRFTGGLLLGKGFIRELYVHMGFHPAWKYERVLELEFEDGKLTVATDHTSAAKDFRASLDPNVLRPAADADARSIGDWIDRTFSRAYDIGDPFGRD